MRECFLCAVTNLPRSSVPRHEAVWRKLALEHRNDAGSIDLLHCHLQCWAAVFPVRQPEQWVEPMLVWLVWLGGKWKPLSRFFFSLPHPNAKHRREVIWIAKAPPAMLIWHWTISIGGWLSTCWFCFVLSCVLKWASLSAVTLSMGWCSAGRVPWRSGLVILVKMWQR